MKTRFYLGFYMLAFLALVALVSTSVNAETMTIATGKAGGGYATADDVLAQRLAQRGNDVTVKNLNGSDEITLAICSGQAQLGRTQIDAIYARAKEGCTLLPVAIHGAEYAIMMVPPKSKIDELSDLTETSKVLVDTVGSGSELFWRTIVSIEQGDDGSNNDWAKARAVMEPVKSANTLAEFGDVDAVIMIRKLDSKDIELLMSVGWTFAEVYDKDINDLIFNDKPLYEDEKIKTPQGKLWTYVVRSFVVARDRQVVELVRGVM